VPASRHDPLLDSIAALLVNPEVLRVQGAGCRVQGVRL